MVYAHDTRAALAAAAVLVNSAKEPDTLTTVAELDDYFREHRYAGRHDRTRAELEEVRALRPRLRELLTAERDQAVAVVNQLLRGVPLVPQLVRHDDWDWHLHVVEADQPLAVRIAVETAMAISDVIRADELSRLSVCAAADCDGVVVDLSRNRSRRFCSVTCGNREAVAAYRARKATES